MTIKPSSNAIHRSLSSAILLGSLVAAASPGCGGGENIEIIGVVTDAAGTPLAGVAVSTGSAADSTDEKGFYRLILEDSGADWPSTAGGNPGRMVLRADIQGYAPLLQVLHGKPSVRRYNLPMAMAPLQEQSVPPEGMTTSVMLGDRHVDITIPPNQGGGGLTLRTAGFDPKNGPGALMGSGPDGQTALQAAGMFYLDIVDQYGSSINVGPLSFGMDYSNLETPPDAEEMKVWRMGDDAMWSNPQDPAAVGPGGPADDPSADDFGYWNYDRAYRTACVKGKVESSEGECIGSFIRADGPDGISSYDASGIDGDFCVNGAQTYNTELHIGSYVTNITMPSSPGACWSSDSCHDIGTITVPDDICITQEEWEEDPDQTPDMGMICQEHNFDARCPNLIFELCIDMDANICYFQVDINRFTCTNCASAASESCAIEAAQYFAQICNDR